MQNSNRPRRLAKPFGADAGGGFIRQVPVAAQTGGAASYSTGFPPENFQPVGSGGVPPSGQDMNGVLFDATGNAMAYAAGMPAMFDAGYASAIGGYPMYAQLASITAGILWQSTVDNNLTDPDSGGASGWVQTSITGSATGDFYRLPGGIIEQWGIVNFSSTGEPVVPASLVVPFSDAFYNLSVTGFVETASTASDTWAQIIRSSKTTNGFSVQYQRGAGATNPRLDGFEWRAVGR